jgi:hypothetical protein
MTSNWRDVPQDLVPAWQAIFSSSHEILHLSAPCPVCGEATLFQFFQLYRPYDEWDRERG